MCLSLSETCRQFFDAVEASDPQKLALLIAPNAIRSQNGSAAVPLSPVADPRVRQAIAAKLGPVRYEDVRQVVGIDVVVEQHRVRSTRRDGSVIDADVCVVMRFDGQGRVVRLDEYFDPAAFS